MLTVVGNFPDPFLHLQKMSLFSFFYFASAIKDNYVCTVITIATFIYDCTVCMVMCVPVQVQVQFFCFHEKAKSLEPNAPPVKVACPVHVVCCQACTCKETSCCEVTVLTTATRSATDTVLVMYVISQSGLASYLPYRHKSGACTAV